MTAVIARALGAGFRPAAGIVVGVAIADAILSVVVLVGMAAMAEALGRAFIVVKLIGAAYLIWLAIQLWRRAGANAAPTAASTRDALSGFLVGVTNPKAIAFYAAFLPGFVDFDTLGAADVVLVTAIVTLVLLTMNLIVAAAAARARRALASGRARRYIDRLAATLFVGSGIALATR
jgi:threonine/homoserine/homoserine lactone efflux protein